MARKPLIDPNALNQGGSTPRSTISRILQQDRQSNGRSGGSEPIQPEVQDTNPSSPVNSVTSEPVNESTAAPVLQTADELANGLADEPATQPREAEPVSKVPEPLERVPAPVEVLPKGRQKNTPVGASGRSGVSAARRSAAEEKVDEMGQTPHKQIGPRIPSAWDDWLEDYVYARRKSGLQKQDIIRGLVREFIVNEMAREVSREDSES